MIDASNSNLAKKIAVLGAPIDIGASQRGTLMGPAALRTAGLLTLLDGLGFEVRDHGEPSDPFILCARISRKGQKEAFRLAANNHSRLSTRFWAPMHNPREQNS